MKPHVIRLRPGQDLKASVDTYLIEKEIAAGCIVTCVGSLRKATLRFANQDSGIMLTGYFEIVSLTGVLSASGSHYHIAIADEQGKVFGAHLLDGSEIYTTAEIVLLQFDEYQFVRVFDQESGYPELNPILTNQKER